VVLGLDGRLYGDQYCQPVNPEEWVPNVLDDRCVRVRLATFVSILISRAAVAAVGLPVKEFFLMRDDWEYTDRIAQRFKNYCVVDSRVLHKIAHRLSTNEWYRSQKFGYCVRNDVLWIRLRRNSLLRKGRALCGQFAWLCWWIARGRMPVKLFGWFVQGLTMRCQVEFP
jgi:GT2 family glycosyltransferase